MSKTIRYKLSEEEYRVVLESAQAVGLSADRLAYQALAYVLRQARQLQDKVQREADAALASQAMEVEDGDHLPKALSDAAPQG